jgi:4-amino-4-deoxy-L-arabinose transferase-like glycosyltransferase
MFDRATAGGAELRPRVTTAQRSLGTRAAARWASLCIAAGAALVLVTVMRTSITVDEPYYYDYGRRIVVAATFARPHRIDDSKLPVSALNVLPEWAALRTGLDAEWARVLIRRWFPERDAAYIGEHLRLYAGRVVTVAFYVALCWLVFTWGAEIYGPSGGLAATALIAFLPTLLGHAGLITVDVAAACTMFAAVYTWARCVRRPSVARALAAGAALGLAQLVKYTAVELFPIAFVILLARAVAAPAASRWRMARASLASLLLAVAMAIVVINAGFGFQDSGRRLVDLPCHSAPCRALRAPFGKVPLPVPYEYLHGLDLVIHYDQTRIPGGPVYLLGQISRDGFASYYLIATAIKTPLAFLLLVVLRPWRRERRYDDFVLLVAVMWLFVHLSFFFKTQLGLRYFLPAFPFLALLAAGNWDPRRTRRQRMAATAVLAVYVVSGVAQCPRYLAYFNVLIGARSNAYRYLADSNLDWGQDAFALWAWERAHQGQRYAVEPYFPAEGLVIVRANDFLGITDWGAYDWLRASGAPVVGTIGDSYLMLNVSPPTDRGESK